MNVLAVTVCVFVGVTEGHFVLRVEVVIDLSVDLPTIQLVRPLKGHASQIAIPANSTNPGEAGRIQAIAHIEAKEERLIFF